MKIVFDKIINSMNKLTIFFLFFSCIFCFANAQAQQKLVKSINIVNNSNIPFTSKLVEIPWSKILNSNEIIDTSKIIVIDAITKKQLAFQFETLGKSAIINLLVKISLQPKQIKKLLVAYGERILFATQTYGRYVPERKDDFAWENDKIAFRMYGKALENTPKEMAYGIDVWVKRTNKLILNERYKTGEYHIDHGDGLDYYHVGLTLGAGNMMPYINDSIYYSKNYVEYKILDNGPLRTTFQLSYNEWEVGNKKTSAVKTISLDAGSQLNKIAVNYYTNSIDGLPVIAGIITRRGNGMKYLNEQNGTMVYWEPEHDKDGITGVACIFNTTIEKMIATKEQLLAKTITNKEYYISYYAGAVWNKAGDIKDAQQWIQYVNLFQQQLKNPLQISK